MVWHGPGAALAERHGAGFNDQLISTGITAMTGRTNNDAVLTTSLYTKQETYNHGDHCSRPTPATAGSENVVQ